MRGHGCAARLAAAQVQDSLLGRRSLLRRLRKHLAGSAKGAPLARDRVALPPQLGLRGGRRRVLQAERRLNFMPSSCGLRALRAA